MTNLELFNPLSAYTSDYRNNRFFKRGFGDFQQLRSSRQINFLIIQANHHTHYSVEYIVPSNFSPFLGNPSPIDSLLEGEVTIMPEKEDKDYEKILEEMLNAHKNSPYIKFQTDAEMIDFIHHCENFFNKSTKEHICNFEINGFEGNVDERRWYRFATILLEKGKTLEEISIRS